MKNIKHEIKANILTITIDLKKEFGYSKSGKTIIIATTEGNQQFPFGDLIVSLGVNCYRKPNGKDS